MKLYHGTNNQNIEYFDINKSEDYNDFGKGIYFTSNFSQAKKWATRKGKGAIYEIDFDFNNLKYNVLNYKDNDENFYYFCYLCIYGTEDTAIETIPNFQNADIISGRMIRNYDDFVEYMKIFHGEEDYNNSIAYAKTGEINTFKDLRDKVELWDEEYDQYCFREKAVEIMHKSLTKVYYVEKDKKEPKSEQLLEYDEKLKKIKKKRKY